MSKDISILPHPRCIVLAEGEFQITPETSVSWTGVGAATVAELLVEYLRPATGFALPVVAHDSSTDRTIHLVCRGNPDPDEAGFYPENYSIAVQPGSATLSADSPAGLVRSVQTLRQLLPEQIFSTPVSRAWNLPCITIEDSPRWRWRGLHLDVARHFFSVEEVCRFIDLMALHRFSVCHLHLADDQGWRVEIEKYPLLTQVAAQRRQTLVGLDTDRPRKYDGQAYGGFFSKDDIRKIVNFAEKRKITIVPEIELPGHSQAVLSAYPEFGCTGEKLETRCHWGISQHVYNVEERTIAFLCDVLDEVIDLFPSRFIHIGGDEAPKHQWSESARVQQRMVELGVKNEDQLQSWFIGRISDHLRSRGRRLIGWDEILEGGLASGAAVMSWRGEEGGLAAARLGHDVVMANSRSLYFDHYQIPPTEAEPLAIGGLSTTEEVYVYNMIPKGLEKEFEGYIMGGQGQLWTEYISNFPHLEFMAYPRACALAETLWLPEEEKNLPRFLTALKRHRERLDLLGVNAHPRP